MLNIVSGPVSHQTLHGLSDRLSQSEASMETPRPMRGRGWVTATGGEELVIQKMWTVKSSVTTLGTYCGRFHNKPMAMLQCYNELTMRGSSGWWFLYPGLWWIKHYPVTKSKSIGAKRKVKNINVCGSSSNLQLQNISIYEGKQKPYSGSHKWLHKAGRCSTFGNSRLFSEQRMTVCNNDWASAAFIPPQGPLEKCLENLFNFTPIIRRQRQL